MNFYERLGAEVEQATAAILERNGAQLKRQKASGYLLRYHVSQGANRAAARFGAGGRKVKFRNGDALTVMEKSGPFVTAVKKLIA